MLDNLDVLTEEMVQLAFHDAMHKSKSSFLLDDNVSGPPDGARGPVGRVGITTTTTAVAGVKVASAAGGGVVDPAELFDNVKRFQLADHAWRAMQGQLEDAQKSAAMSPFSPLPLKGLRALIRCKLDTDTSVQDLMALWRLENEVLRRYEEREKLKAFFQVRS